MATRNLPDLPESTGLLDTDLLHTRQGPTDKSLTGSLLKQAIAVASITTFDNVVSGLTATNVQAAIDEVVADNTGTAIDTTFDNAASGLTATNVQAAIDEVVADNTGTAIDTTFDNAASGLTATNVQAAIDEVVANPSGSLPSHSIFTMSGTYMKPIGLVGVKITVTAGGGAGGGGDTMTPGSSGSGGAGGTVIAFIEATMLSSSETITVGAGGLGVLASGGNPGGTSSFGTFETASGGTGGVSIGAGFGIGASGGTSPSLSGVIIDGGWGERDVPDASLDLIGGASYWGGGGGEPVTIGGAYGAGGTGVNNPMVSIPGINGRSGIVHIEEYF